MLVVPEALIAGLVSEADALEAVRGCFAAMARNEALHIAQHDLSHSSPPPPTRRGGSWAPRRGGIFRPMRRAASPTTSRWFTCSIPKAGGPRRWWAATC